MWLPKGAGPFPVVFILHGDHSMQDFSDGGYGYIAQSLAANGFISVSVDNNFLNRSWSDLLMTSTLQGPAEIEVRAKLLVEHFKFWSKWNADPDSPLYQKVDLNNIALVGHSRGGETVSVVPHILTNQNITDVRVKSIISIAPTDGNFWPDGQANHLNDVNYLLMQGSMDGEVPFNGRGQYSRTDVYTQDDAIKLALYIEGANHGQFNTSWGMNDKEFVSPVASRWNLSGIMPAVAQRGIAKDVIESFLNYSIKGRDDEKAYLIKSGLKNKWRSISEIKTQYDFGGIAPLIDFESDTQEDLTAEEGVASSIESLGLSVHAQLIHWQGCAVGEECSVSYDLTRFDKVQGRQLRFDIANMMDNNLGLTVEISYFGGSLKTSNVVLPPKISRYLTKLDTHLKRKSSEVVFETISLNLDADLYVESVKFILNESPSRAFFVDNIVVL